MMVGLSTVEYDAFGSMMLKIAPGSTVNEFARRITRVATLNGETALTDMGYVVGESSLVFKISGLNNPGIDNLVRIVKNHSKVRISTKFGVYEGSISRLNLDSTPIQLVFLPSKLVSE